MIPTSSPVSCHSAQSPFPVISPERALSHDPQHMVDSCHGAQPPKVCKEHVTSLPKYVKNLIITCHSTPPPFIQSYHLNNHFSIPVHDPHIITTILSQPFSIILSESYQGPVYSLFITPTQSCPRPPHHPHNPVTAIFHHPVRILSFPVRFLSYHFPSPERALFIIFHPFSIPSMTPST